MDTEWLWLPLRDAAANNDWSLVLCFVNLAPTSAVTSSQAGTSITSLLLFNFHDADFQPSLISTVSLSTWKEWRRRRVEARVLFLAELHSALFDQRQHTLTLTRFSIDSCGTFPCLVQIHCCICHFHHSKRKGCFQRSGLSVCKKARKRKKSGRAGHLQNIDQTTLAGKLAFRLFFIIDTNQKRSLS